jgi:PrtD family type I secretion system ABC transporter
VQIFQHVVPSGSLETLAVLTLITAAAIATLAILDGVRDMILLRAGLWLDHHLGEHILSNGVKRGASSADMQQDVKALERVRVFLDSGAMAPLLDAPWVPVFLIALFLIHPMIGAVATAATSLLIAAAFLQKALTSRLAHEAGLANERTARWATAVAGNTNLAAAVGLADGAAGQWELSNRTHIAGLYALGKRESTIKVLSRTIRSCSLIALFGVGASLIVHNELSPGVLVAAAVLLARALAPFEHLNASWREARGAYCAYQRLKALPAGIDSSSITAGGAVPHGVIEVSDAGYEYQNRETPALSGISLTLQPGECLGIAGPNGSGKSTLAAILAGALHPTAGSADLDGISISNWQRAGAAPVIGYLPDEPMLLEGTVHSNIARFQDATPASVAHASQLAGVHDVLAGLPSGFDTPVGHGGSGLALRERRAVALARAVHGAPHAIVLDEPEIGLDAFSVRRLVNALQGLKNEGVSLIIATQDPRLLALADQVAVLNGGIMQGARKGFDSVCRITPVAVEPVYSRAAGAGVH